MRFCAAKVCGKKSDSPHVGEQFSTRTKINCIKNIYQPVIIFIFIYKQEMLFTGLTSLPMLSQLNKLYSAHSANHENVYEVQISQMRQFSG